MKSLRVILVRHGGTASSRERRVEGSRDVPLSPEARLRAERVASALAAPAPAAVYASPVARARETAEIIAKPHRLSVSEDEAFGALASGEDLGAARARALAGIERLRAAHAGETVVVVSHGVIVRLVVLDALGLPPDRLGAVHATAAGITEIEYGGGWTTVHRMNTLQHLEPAREP